jgi:hypothetical protein
MCLLHFSLYHWNYQSTDSGISLNIFIHFSSLTGVGVVRVAHCFSFCVVFVCLRPVSCVPTDFSVSGLFILDCPSGFS